MEMRNEPLIAWRFCVKISLSKMPGGPTSEFSPRPYLARLLRLLPRFQHYRHCVTVEYAVVRAELRLR